MPSLVSDTPTISQVYGAFDGTSHQLFRGAMSHSRGGVVCVEDLLVALGEHCPGAIDSPLGAAIRTAQSRRRPADEPHLVAMANEPTLRRLLATAYQLTAGRARATGALITPDVLVEAALRCRPIVALTQLARTAGSAQPRIERSQPKVSANLIEDLLQEWLAVQTSPAGGQREQSLARFLALSRLLRTD
jgi:hypothetical protein